MFEDLAQEIDRERSSLCRIDGEVVAVAFVFSADYPTEVVTEALTSTHPKVRSAVGSCMAHAIGALTGVVQFDGHERTELLA